MGDTTDKIKKSRTFRQASAYFTSLPFLLIVFLLFGILNAPIVNVGNHSTNTSPFAWLWALTTNLSMFYISNLFYTVPDLMELDELSSLPVNVLFIKPAKIGGTTVHEVLVNWQQADPWGYALYDTTDNPLGWRITYSEATAFAYSNRERHVIFASHGEYALWMDYLLPNEPLFKFTMLRDPYDRCRSEYYYRLKRGYSESYRPPVDYLYNTIRGPHTDIVEILDAYHVVGLMEQFDEFLLVVKNLLHLKYEQITYLKENANAKKPAKADMPEELYDEFQALYAHQPHDQPLYEAAVVRFESTKETFQPTFKAQLGSFKNKLAILAAATQNEV